MKRQEIYFWVMAGVLALLLILATISYMIKDEPEEEMEMPTIIKEKLMESQE